MKLGYKIIQRNILANFEKNERLLSEFFFHQSRGEVLLGTAGSWNLEALLKITAEVFIVEFIILFYSIYD